MEENKQYIVQYNLADGSSVYHSTLKGDFYPRTEREFATVFSGKKYAEREADKIMEREKDVVCYSVQEA